MSKQKGTLGKALQNQQKKKYQDKVSKVSQPGQFVHIDCKPAEDIYQVQQRNLQSIVDQDSLNEYLQLAELANQKFDAEKRGEIVKSEVRTENKQIILNVNAARLQSMQKNDIYDIQRNKLMRDLQIPRRPDWNNKMQIQELRDRENESFLKWRRNLAKFEEENYTITLTPYEKNIEVWKQLWRVVEKSDILVQVVDGRDILFFRCQDLERYVVESKAQPNRRNQTKHNFLLINKSDLLHEEVREVWNKYLLANNVDHMFFSAKQEQERIDLEANEQQESSNILSIMEEPQDPDSQELTVINTAKLANRKTLLSELKKLVWKIRNSRTIEQKQEQEQRVVQEESKEQKTIEENLNEVVIGMVGYPNVGKSSVINTLCHKKLVGVAARPGKTKHFQTIQLEKDILLCDCPGLVFPNAASSRGEMVINGVLPIDNIKDHLSPVDILVNRIPKIVFEILYGLNLKDTKTITSSDLLQSYSSKRGYITGNAIPDEAKASKFILKDFINGRLLYCKPPPDGDYTELWTSNKLEGLNQLILDANEQEKKQQEQIVLNEKYNKQTQPTVKLSNDDLMQIFSQDDLLDLMEGKRIKGVKLTKAHRREIKFCYQRGEPIDLKKYLVTNQDLKTEQHKTNVKGHKISY